MIKLERYQLKCKQKLAINLNIGLLIYILTADTKSVHVYKKMCYISDISLQEL